MQFPPYAALIGKGEYAHIEMRGGGASSSCKRRIEMSPVSEYEFVVSSFVLIRTADQLPKVHGDVTQRFKDKPCERLPMHGQTYHSSVSVAGRDKERSRNVSPHNVIPEHPDFSPPAPPHASPRQPLKTRSHTQTADILRGAVV